MSVIFHVFDDVLFGVFEAVTNVFFHNFIILYKPVDEISVSVYHYFDIHRNNDF